MLDLTGRFARNMTKSPQFLLVTGASGRVGQLLRTALPGSRLGGVQVLWHARNPGPGIDIAWAIGRQAPPDLPPGTPILHLAGRTSGSEAALADNLALAQEVADLALRLDAPLLHMSTAAVYAPAPRDLTEDDIPAPASAYGQAKLHAEQALTQALPKGAFSLLRMANLAGADTLFGNMKAGLPLTLDPVPGQSRGPIRSYIGPVALAGVLDALVGRLAAGQPLPTVLNLAQPGALAMADVLDAAGASWTWGPPRPAAIPRVTLSSARLAALVALQPATPAGLVAELAALAQAAP